MASCGFLTTNQDPPIFPLVKNEITRATYPLYRNHASVNLGAVEVLYAFRSILAGGHRDVTETSYTRSASISDYFGSDDLNKKKYPFK